MIALSYKRCLDFYVSSATTMFAILDDRLRSIASLQSCLGNTPSVRLMLVCNYLGRSAFPCMIDVSEGSYVNPSSRNLRFTHQHIKADIKMSSKKLYEKTREQSISDFEAQTKDLQKEHPDVDFKAVVIEPTMNLMFDIKVRLLILYRAH
jgi:hypothetical protein